MDLRIFALLALIANAACRTQEEIDREKEPRRLDEKVEAVPSYLQFSLIPPDAREIVLRRLDRVAETEQSTKSKGFATESTQSGEYSQHFQTEIPEQSESVTLDYDSFEDLVKTLILLEREHYINSIPKLHKFEPKNAEIEASSMLERYEPIELYDFGSVQEDGLQELERNNGNDLQSEGSQKPEINSHGFIGSYRGRPGVDYPNLSEIPLTSFSCVDKNVPGFYADVETGCQVFHVCYEHRRESFLCPPGTIFNQPILACDYWYSANCSTASGYYDVDTPQDPQSHEPEPVDEVAAELIEEVYEEEPCPEAEIEEPKVTVDIPDPVVEKPKVPISIKEKPRGTTETPQPEVEQVLEQFEDIVPNLQPEESELASIIPFLPIKAKITTFSKIKSKAAFGGAVPFVMKAKTTAKTAATFKAKALASSAAIPVVKAKAAVPIVKAKVAKAAVPIVKAKVAKAAVPIVKAKVAKAIPVAKVVKAAAAVPIVKSKVAKRAVLPVKAKIVKAKAAAVPVGKLLAIKAKTLAIPVVKAKAVAAKVVVAPAISALTKKGLALAYIKLLKAKKLALLG